MKAHDAARAAMAQAEKKLKENPQWTPQASVVFTPKELDELLNKVRADEREACADIAENWNSNGSPRVGVAAQIRARGNT